MPVNTLAIGLLLVVGGTIAAIKQKWIVDNLGHSRWAEKNLGSTYTLVFLVAIAAIILGFLVLFGFFQQDEAPPVERQSPFTQNER